MKKNNIKIYAQALAEIVLSKKSVKPDFTQKFLKLLQKNGLERKAKEIMKLAEEIVLAKKGNKKIVIETARQASQNQKKLLHGVAKQGDIIKEKINPELIAGVKIIINDNKQFDSSIQKKLQNIFN